MPAKSKKSTVVATAMIEGPESTPAAAPFPTLGLDSLSLESLADLGRENLAAVAQANRALSEGMQAIGQEILLYARSSLESASQTATALLGAKTLDEVIQLNSDLAQESLKALLARSAKLSEMGVTVASETLAPLGVRVEATITKFAKPAMP
ncbi:MAG TPA: phasin family protein [Stellaceae bacterium]|nr:phasin family protein [Stellaceae bacterium]